MGKAGRPCQFDFIWSLFLLLRLCLRRLAFELLYPLLGLCPPLAVRLREVRELPPVLYGALLVALLLEGKGKPIVAVGEGGVYLKGLPLVLCRHVEIALVVVGEAQVVVGLGALRVIGEDRLVFFYGLVNLPFERVVHALLELPPCPGGPEDIRKNP